MALIAFTANYTDHSNDNGFQFEFHCDKCHNGHMTPFVANKLSMAGGFLRAASSLFGGGTLDRLASAGDHVKDSLRGKARDDAFAWAVQEAKKYFKQCSRCGQWVCPEHCWNADAGLCEACAPDLAEEAAAARATAAKEQVWQKARETSLVEDVNIKAPQVATCPHCGAKATGGKFCPECGGSLSPKTECPGCKAKIKPGAKFCGECGAKL